MKMNRPLIAAAFLAVILAAIALWQHKRLPVAPAGVGESAGQATTVGPAPTQGSPVTQQSQPATVSDAPVTPRKKFADMGVLEARAITSEIAKQDLPAIFQAMIDAKRVEQDSRKQFSLKNVFSNALNDKKPSPEFLEQLYGFINDRANSEFERSLLIGALQEAATPETFDLLIRVANSSPDKKMREYAGSLGDVGDNPQNRPELSPILERTWRETGNPTLIISTASAMARIGKPSGIEMLLSAALATDERDKKRRIAAESALWEVFVGDAVPPLAARLANKSPTSPEVQLVAPILARITDPSASKAVVDWLQDRRENAAPLIHDYIRQHMRGDPFTSAWATALDPAVPFKNEENRKAIREALDAYRAGRARR